MSWVSVSPGMKLQDRNTGRRYHVRSVVGDHVTTDSPSGTINVGRAELEDHIWRDRDRALALKRPVSR